MPAQRDQLTQRVPMGLGDQVHGDLRRALRRAEGRAGRRSASRPGAGGLRQHAPRRPRRADGVHRGRTRARSAPFPRPSGARSWSRTSPASSASAPIRRGTSRRDWSSEPYSRGRCCGGADPRDLTAYGRALREPVGRIYRAGPRPRRAGWAISTASSGCKRAAGEVLAAEGAGGARRPSGSPPRRRRPGGHLAGQLDQRGELALELAPAGARPAPRRRRRRAPVRRETRSRAPGRDVVQHLAQLGLGPDGSEQPGAGADHQNRLPLERVVREGREAQSIAFETAGDRGVVLGVLITAASADAIASRRRCTAAARGRCRGPRCRSAARRSRPAPARPGGSSSAAARSRRVLWESLRSDPEMPTTFIATRPLPALTSSRWTFRVTSQSRTSPPLGSSICQSKPKSRRSNLVSSSNATRPFPSGPSIGPCRCPWRSPSWSCRRSRALRDASAHVLAQLDRAGAKLTLDARSREELHAKHGRGTPRARGSRSTRPWRRPPAPARPRRRAAWR